MPSTDTFFTALVLSLGITAMFLLARGGSRRTQSPTAVIEEVELLLACGRHDQALALLERSLLQFPGEPVLREKLDELQR